MKITVITFCILLVGSFLTTSLKAQNNENSTGVVIGDGTYPPHPSAVLDIRSNSKAVLLTRVASTGEIDYPEPGMIVFSTDDNTFYYYYYYKDDVKEIKEWRKLVSAPAKYPVGSIIMYSGFATAEYFTTDGAGVGSCAGWQICNGNNNSPDLRDRFVAGVNMSDKDFSWSAPSGGVVGDTDQEKLRSYKSLGKIEDNDQYPEKPHNEFTMSVSTLPNHTHSIANGSRTFEYEHSHPIEEMSDYNSNQAGHTHEIPYSSKDYNGDGLPAKLRYGAGKSICSFPKFPPKDEVVFLHYNAGGILNRDKEPRALIDNTIDDEDAIGKTIGTTDENINDNIEPINNEPPYYLVLFLIKTN